MIQYFEWYMEPTPHLWVLLAQRVQELAETGFTAIWLPPAFKGSGGIYDVGYGPYDLYDVGEFDQKNTIPTKYGTKEEYLQVLSQLQKHHLQVICDIVLNHKMGADATEEVPAIIVKDQARNEQISDETMVEAWTKFTFDNRHDKYSSFKWNWHHFDGVDYDNKTHQKAIYRLYGKTWDSEVSNEFENYDYLMGADLDFQNPEVVDELYRWGLWYQTFTNMDGVRLDACKHIQFSFFKGWLSALRKQNPDLFAVGEYWSYNLDELLHYLQVNENSLSLFDVPLHGHLREASSSNGQYDLRNLFEGTLVNACPQSAVTFVDNHDTQPCQSLSSWVLEWFKPAAYSIILLRKDGYPCVFYGDYEGIAKDGIPPMKPWLKRLVETRRRHNYGPQHDYLDDSDLIGWTREGDDTHSGLACILTDTTGGCKRMYVGTRYAHQRFVDVLEHMRDDVVIEEDGTGNFRCKEGSASVYVLKETSI